MSPLERQIISEKIRAMTPEEMKCVVKQIPNGIIEGEVRRRYIAAEKKIEVIFEIINAVQNTQMDLDQMTDFLKAIRSTVSA